MLGELTRKHETNSRLDLAGRERGLLVVFSKVTGLAGDALEDVVDERVHDGHSLLADAGVGVDLLEDLVDVGGVGFDALLAALLLAVGGGLDGLRGGCLLGGCLCHGGNERDLFVEIGRGDFVRSVGWSLLFNKSRAKFLTASTSIKFMARGP